MIAFVLRETGRDPAWLIGAPVPQLGSNAGFGAGLPRRRGRRVGPHRVRAAGRDRRRHERRARPSHASTRPLARARARVRRVARRRDARRPRRAARTTASSPLPGEHNRLNAGAALAALELAGVPRARPQPALARFTGTGRRFEIHELGDVTLVDDYGHHPTEVAATIAAARERLPGASRPRALPAAPLLAHASSRGRAGRRARGADDVTVTDVYPAREQPVTGVTASSSSTR